MKTALVTGGNRGIGKSIVSGLADKGFKVLLGCRDLNRGAEVAKELAGEVIPFELNLNDCPQLEQQIMGLLQNYPEIDVLVNNAGVLHEGGVLTGEVNSMSDTMQVNLMAPFVFCKFIVPGMLERNYGRVINLSSGWGSFNEGLEGPASYSISKASINALTMTLSRELTGDVTVNSMCPGWVKTQMGGDQAPRSPDEGASTAIWLATQDTGGPNGKFFRDNKEINW